MALRIYAPSLYVVEDLLKVLYKFGICCHTSGCFPAYEVQPRTGHLGPEEEQRYSSTLSLTSAPDSGGWSAQRTRPFTPGKETGTHCVGGWVGPRVGLDGCGKSRPHWDSISGPFSSQRIAIPTELLRLTFPAYTARIFKFVESISLFVAFHSQHYSHVLDLLLQRGWEFKPFPLVQFI